MTSVRWQKHLVGIRGRNQKTMGDHNNQWNSLVCQYSLTQSNYDHTKDLESTLYIKSFGNTLVRRVHAFLKITLVADGRRDSGHNLPGRIRIRGQQSCRSHREVKWAKLSIWPWEMAGNHSKWMRCSTVLQWSQGLVGANIDGHPAEVLLEFWNQPW